MYDVLVVGAGPTGSYVASRLAAAGRKVVVFEQNQRIGKATCCTGIVGKDCLDAFPVCSTAVLREARSARFFAPSGRCLRVEAATTQAYILDRLALDAALARSAQEQGAEYWLGSRVTDIVAADDSIHARVAVNGRSLNVRAKTAVIACGFGSRLSRNLGLGAHGDFAMGAQSQVETNGTQEVEVYFGSRTAPGFFAWVVPTSDNRALAGLLSRQHTGARLRCFLRSLVEQGKVASCQATISFGGVPLEPAHRTSGHRVLLVGDAAGQVKPTTGGGIYYGLLSAQVAADTLEEALRRNDFTATALARYDRGWRAMLSAELKAGRRARWFFERLNDRQIEWLFETAESRRIPERLAQSPDFCFDRHGRVIRRGARLLGLEGILGLLWSFVRNLPLNQVERGKLRPAAP